VIAIQDSVLQRFKRFRAMVLSSNLPSDTLLDMAEIFITSPAQDLPAEDLTILDGQLSLADVT
jgi:hypothetical protein